MSEGNGWRRVAGGAEPSRRGARSDRSVLLFIVILLGVAAATVFATIRLRTDELSDRLRDTGRVAALLVLGGGDTEFAFELLFLDATTDRAALLHVPGTVGVLLEGEGAEERARVGALSTLYENGDTAQLLATVGRLVDTDVAIHLDVSGRRVQQLVDLIGGVEVFIPNPVDTRGSGDDDIAAAASSALPILLPSGSIRLDGEKAAAFLRLELPHESRVDRANRIHRLVQASFKQLGDVADTVLHPTVRRRLHQLLEPNLATRAFDTLLDHLTRTDAERMIFQNVLGSVQDVDGVPLIFPYYDGELVRETVSQIQQNLQRDDPGELIELNPSIEVLNGTDVTGLARRAANLLQSYGYEIVRIDNADHDEYTNTVVIDRRGKLETAERLGELLSCRRSLTEYDADADAAVDITVVLGRDFDGRRCAA